VSKHEELIERCAQALREHVGNRSGRGVPWSKLLPKVQQSYRDEATVVLVAAGLITDRAA
jgi:hypothetical protein